MGWDDHGKLLISSFSHVALEASLEMTTDWHRGLILPAEWPENWQDLAAYLKISTFNINGNECSREQVQTLLEQEKQILAYTINDDHRARLLQSWGVDGFFTDSPDVLQDGLLSVH